MLSQTLTTLPKISGFNFRLVRGEEDYPALVEMINASNAADDVEQCYTLEDFAHEFNHLPNFDPQSDALLIEKGDKVVGGIPVYWRQLDDGARAVFLRSSFAPRSRQINVMTAALKWAEDRARERCPISPDAPRYADMWCPSTAIYKTQLAEDNGYAVTRYFYLMLYSPLENFAEVKLPEGVELRETKPEHYHPIWDALVEAFRDHWGHTAKTEKDYEGWRSSPHFDPSLYRVAWAKNEIVGASVNTIYKAENDKNGFKRGWIDTLGVRRPWRKRGVAGALIVDSLKALCDRGMTEGVLGVDAENPTGALRLYEKIGFKVFKKSMVYRKNL